MAVWRIEVHPADDRHDAVGRARTDAIRAFGFPSSLSVTATRVYFVQAPDDRSAVRSAADRLLADPVAERIRVSSADDDVPAVRHPAVEVHLRPGVMDPVAASTLDALRTLGLDVRAVRTAWRYDVHGHVDERTLRTIARRALANDCIEEVFVLGFDDTRPPGVMPAAPRYEFALRHIPLTDASDDELLRLSRDGHLFLSLDEMRAIQRHFQNQGRDPTDLELETLAQTWSEHCVHKTLKSEIVYRGAPMPSSARRGHAIIGENRVEARYGNLLRDTIAAATNALNKEWCLSVFADNAGIIALDRDFGVAFKVETHNHPSAIEPYGGAATGVGGCIRDIIGCGLGAQPIANTDVFCFAPPDWPEEELPPGVLHPRTIMRGVVAGVRDYGNCMGIPTVNGAIHFDPRYLGNPLVYCGCVGLIPRNRISKAARPGDAIVLVGGRTGRDGIHGATFSSAELTDTHADEFSHAVQIGNPITEKKALECILQARDHQRGCLFSAITDCGAGGLSSAVGEMGERTGASVNLERVPLKYEGLRYDEIWISEAQERMVLAVPPASLDTLLALFAAEDVEATVIGQFTDDHALTVRYNGEVVGRIDMEFLHHGLPRASRVATWSASEKSKRRKVEKSKQDPDAERIEVDLGIGTEHFASETEDERHLKRSLGGLNAASKEWVIRQYDHEVQSRSVIKPLVGPGAGPSDAAVIRPRLDSDVGVALGCGLCPHVSDDDPYWMAVAAVDEAVRNVVCVGGNPDRTAILDNFCWGRTDDERQLGALVRACQGAHDAAVALGTPFISGKDSLNNEFAMDPADAARLAAYLETRADEFGVGGGAVRNNRLAIPGTLLISAISIVENVRGCVTMDLKPRDSDDLIEAFWVAWEQASPSDDAVLDVLARLHRFIHEGIRAGHFVAVHDYCDDGLLAATAEMAIAGDCGVLVFGDSYDSVKTHDVLSGYVVQLHRSTRYVEWFAEHRARMLDDGLPGFHTATIVAVTDDANFRIRRDAEPEVIISMKSLADSWRAPLAW